MSRDASLEEISEILEYACEPGSNRSDKSASVLAFSDGRTDVFVMILSYIAGTYINTFQFLILIIKVKMILF